MVSTHSRKQKVEAFVSLETTEPPLNGVTIAQLRSVAPPIDYENVESVPHSFNADIS